MGVETKTVIKITCDNPDCPGTSGLDPKSWDGWIRLRAETQGVQAPEGMPPMPVWVEGIYCCRECALTMEHTPEPVPLPEP